MLYRFLHAFILQFISLSFVFYSHTVTTRGMVMPDDKSITMKNCIGMFSILGIAYVSATILHYYSASFVEISLACLALFLVLVSLIGK